MNEKATAPLATALSLEPSPLWHQRLDRAGATASFLCAVHCLLAPLLLATAAAGALVFFHHELEALFVATSLTLGGFSLGWGYVRHRKTRVLALYFLAALAFLTGLLGNSTLGNSTLELPSMVAGGLLLAGGHLLNRRYLTL